MINTEIRVCVLVILADILIYNNSKSYQPEDKTWNKSNHIILKYFIIYDGITYG